MVASKTFHIKFSKSDKDFNTKQIISKIEACTTRAQLKSLAENIRLLALNFVYPFSQLEVAYYFGLASHDVE